ncbi:MAG: ribonuclease Y [Minisyncoccus archaeiphilus]|jgi:ribonuclease Y|uniref:ribonuclease Y n=1 Tax=Minisyncoccus archaeiphilus TaxID=3238481 RepID=UPI0009CF18B7|nr:MAG: Ribonuclease Y [Parcubacteria group bacterium ADurb.Bin216]GMX59792.1 MAG: ribonuclease Y [Candidatus Parcubacteria bacterium]
MIDSLMPVIVATIALFAGALVGYYVRQSIARKRAGTIESELQKKITQTKKTVEEMLAKSKEKIEETEKKSYSDLEERQKVVLKAENRLFKKEEEIEEKEKTVNEKEKEISEKLEKLKEIKKDLDVMKEEESKKLEKISGLSKSQAKEELMTKIEKEYEAETLERIRKLEERGYDNYERKAREIISHAVQGYALSQTQEITTSSIAIPSDEIKGRIIGKEGRNIRAFEKATGVELIVDETPGLVIISSFNPVRREIAKIALDRLLKDGRIQPARIEQEIERADQEITKKIKEAGEAAVYETGVLDLPDKLVQILGRLQYRTSYGQNVLDHSIEVAHLSAAIAAEIGLNVSLCRKAGLLHDIGKALDYKVEGSHTDIGGKILEKFNIDKAVISAVKSHHEEYPYESLEARIVQAADQISGARPGARKDTLEHYLKRLEDLEDIAMSFSGTEKAYAIQGGRELRVFVHPKDVTETEAHKLAREIAQKIQQELRYPGEIKVLLIRESRIIEYAK